jgi:hypothetical protein
MVAIAELQKFSAGELGAIVGNDGVQHSEPVADVGEE